MSRRAELKPKGNFPLAVPEPLKKRLAKQAERHSTTMTRIILSGTEDKVSELERKKPAL